MLQEQLFLSYHSYRHTDRLTDSETDKLTLVVFEKCNYSKFRMKEKTNAKVMNFIILCA